MGGRATEGMSRAIALARVFELASRQLHARCYAEGLYPAQWAALRYFEDMQRSHSTVAALARYQGLTLASVARTVRTLVSHEYLRRDGSAGPGRAEVIVVTPKGRALLRRDPLVRTAKVLGGLPPASRQALAEALERLITVA